MPEVTDQAYRRCKADRDVVNLIASFAHRYKGSLNELAREEAGERALYRALAGHDPERNNKFTNTLFRFLTWEFNRGHRAERREAGYDAPRHPTDIADIDAEAATLTRPRPPELSDAKREMFLGVQDAMARYLPRATRQAVELHYLRGFGFEDIAREQATSVEVARGRVAGGLTFLREIARDEPGMIPVP